MIDSLFCPKDILDFLCKNTELLLCATLFLLIFSGFGIAYAFEPIPITVSGTSDKIIFDGKWTFEYEWKASSLNTYSYDDGTQVILRSAHKGDFIYIFLDSITDQHLDMMDDYAIVCFDTKNDKSIKANSNDYCFMTSLNGKNSFTYQGGYTSIRNNYFNKIPNPDEFIGISTVSDLNDRYTPIPHPSYEFKIPINLIGRQSVYGFYFLVYDGNSKNTYTYPQNLQSENFIKVPSPSMWGEIYSPDSSLPEFSLPVISLTLAIVLIMTISRVKSKILY